MSQRERLLRRRRPPVSVDIRVDFSPEADAAFVAVEQAERELRMAPLPSHRDAARAKLEEAKTATGLFVETLQVSPIPAPTYEALIAENPPTEDNRARGLIWNPDTFAPALLAACVGQELPESERMTEKDWLDWLSIAGAGLSGDVIRLFQACLQVNGQALL